MPLDTAEARIEGICRESGGRSELYAKGTPGYTDSIKHYYAGSSQFANFAVQPGSADDLSKIMKVIKDFENDHFAVKGGGHTSNPGFSSTNDIHISLFRLKKKSFDEEKMQLTVGAGNTAAEIYEFIQPKGYTVTAGDKDVGISGWMTGGGYSRITSQYGLGIDNLVQAEVVLPHGGLLTANETTNPDLFWAIKGGGNNFGIVTEFVLKTHKRGRVYGGYLYFDKKYVESVQAAVLKFTTQQDRKANVEAPLMFNWIDKAPQFGCVVLAYYDGPEPEPNPFKDFLAIPHTGDLKETTSTKLDTTLGLLYSYMPAEDVISFYNDILADRLPAIPSFPTDAFRARWGNVMVNKYTSELISAVGKEVMAAEKLMATHLGRRIVGDIWPFLPTKGSDSAWPHKVHNEFILVYFVWEGEKNDHIWISQLRGALDRIHQVALQQGCTTRDAPVYSNTSVADFTTPHQIYQNHLADLCVLRGIYDPYDVMKRTGGYRIPSGLTGNITNAKDNATIGVKTLPGAVKIGDITKKIFQISPVGGKSGEYIISIKDGSTIYSAVNDGDEIHCKAQQDSTWRLVPKTRNNDQFEYLIQNGSEYWVLRDGQVKTTTVASGKEAHWHFNLAKA